MGGLGKTTLAQMVYNDEKIANHCEVKCWVCVSEGFVVKTLLKSIIESTGGNARDLEDLDPLKRRVKGTFCGKKFLLVLDDVWNEDQTKWYKLKSLLTSGGIGSSIMVTTRLESVASMTSTLPIWRLEILSKDDYWSLFKHYEFDTENENHPMLEEIGKQITKKCAGLPLAAKALGGLLRFEKTENEWLLSEIVHFGIFRKIERIAILPALRLSYNNLPIPLRECFSYCSVFPKDYEIVRELIHLWMANGFVQSKGSMGLDNIGNEIFNELLWRSFFQDAEKDEYSDIRVCKMHDLVHDLVCSITMNECKVVEIDKDEDAFKGITRHFSLQFGYSSSMTNISNLFPSQSQPLVWTFVLGGSLSSTPFALGLTYSNLKCLRCVGFALALHKNVTCLNRQFEALEVLKVDYCYNLPSVA